MAWIGILFIVVGAIINGIILFSQSGEPPQPPQVVAATSSQDIADLITRLKPIVKDPNGAWYSNGIEISIYGAWAKIKLTLPNGNEYNGEAETLREAVERLEVPSNEIKARLQGWPSTKGGD